MPSKKTARNRRRKAAKKAKSNTAKMSQNIQPISKEKFIFYDVWFEGKKCSIFYDTTNYVAWAKFLSFDWFPLACSQKALKLIRHGTVGGTLLKKPDLRSKVMKNYAGTLNFDYRNSVQTESFPYRRRMRELLLLFPQLVSWLRAKDINEFPGLYKCNSSTRGEKEITEDIFEQIKSLIPGLTNDADKSYSRWNHVPTRWEDVKK